MRSRPLALLAPLAVLLALPPPALADDVLVGVRAGVYTDAGKPFLGAELLLKIAPSVYFNPNLEYVFVENATYFTANADVHYDFHTRSNTMVWAGGGLGIVSFNPEGPPRGDTDLALNLLFGVGFRRHPVIPYFQAKAIVKDDTELSLAFGLRF